MIHITTVSECIVVYGKSANRSIAYAVDQLLTILRQQQIPLTQKNMLQFRSCTRNASV